MEDAGEEARLVPTSPARSHGESAGELGHPTANIRPTRRASSCTAFGAVRLRAATHLAMASRARRRPTSAAARLLETFVSIFRRPYGRGVGAFTASSGRNGKFDGIAVWLRAHERDCIDARAILERTPPGELTGGSAKRSAKSEQSRDRPRLKSAVTASRQGTRTWMPWSTVSSRLILR